MSLIIDSQLFPCIEYIKILCNGKHVKVEQFETFKKMSFRNRFVISGTNGLIHLSIPIKGGREQKVLMRDVLIDDSQNWQIKHWRGIVSAYSKSAFFDYYSSDVQRLLYSGEKSLFDFNIHILRWINELLNNPFEISFTEEFKKTYETDKDLRNTILPKTFQANCENCQPRYGQVFEDRWGFQPNLSFLDLLFCQGPNSKNLILSSVNSSV